RIGEPFVGLDGEGGKSDGEHKQQRKDQAAQGRLLPLPLREGDGGRGRARVPGDGPFHPSLQPPPARGGGGGYPDHGAPPRHKAPHDDLNCFSNGSSSLFTVSAVSGPTKRLRMWPDASST